MIAAHRIRIRRLGNPRRPWVVKQGRVALASYPTWEEARAFTERFCKIALLAA